ncbi:MAG: diaminopimelate epimerase [Gammaproteobacteria bacterium]|nr:MAG: diaminopimelate epimerase [Pseudomonadota bacterium]MBC6944915.1 diaminopimelate epimerase [Gammaproteobacteria bacterium]MCE7896822.1 diaminopimelate epimerase [Gammaproteobacteria bacterium PRO8]MDL1879653.1 diaminopimelate epimerase [Gammaproteobacteria bacterium PRO2]MCL4777338.1 diaminopimelate epimerase [Gammaproteobacteria bacterium]
MQIPFTKMHGLGNDFVVVRAGNGPPPPAEAIRALADRKTGIGFDQLLWLEKPHIAGAAVYYRIFNTDGSEAEQCGNGARCIARLVGGEGAGALVLQHRGGVSRARLELNGLVSVEIAVPRFDPASLPFLADAEAASYRVKVGRRNVELRVVSLGNPHAVLHVDDIDGAPVDTLGAALERHERFPNRANIGFMQVLDPEHIRLRVFERGVGETRACGTGACAAAVVGQRAGWLAPRVHVGLPGGELIVRWDGAGTPVWLTGEAVTAFEGTVDI